MVLEKSLLNIELKREGGGEKEGGETEEEGTVPAEES